MASVFDLLKRRKFEPIPIDLLVSAEEWMLIQKGSKPQSMEDKWVILYRDDFLHFCRSWGKGHAIFKIRPEREAAGVHFSTVWCRRNIEPYYKPNKNTDETTIVTKLIDHRIKKPKDEPWFGWDLRYPKDPKFLNPNFTDYIIK